MASRQSTHLGETTRNRSSLWHSWPLARTKPGAFPASGHRQELESFALRVPTPGPAQLFLSFVVFISEHFLFLFSSWKVPLWNRDLSDKCEKCSLCVKYKAGTRMSQRVRDTAQLTECLPSVQVSLDSTPQDRNWVWWHQPVIPAWRRGGQEDQESGSSFMVRKWA